MFIFYHTILKTCFILGSNISNWCCWISLINVSGYFVKYKLELDELCVVTDGNTWITFTYFLTVYAATDKSICFKSPLTPSSCSYGGCYSILEECERHYYYRYRFFLPLTLPIVQVLTQLIESWWERRVINLEVGDVLVEEVTWNPLFYNNIKLHQWITMRTWAQRSQFDNTCI